MHGIIVPMEVERSKIIFENFQKSKNEALIVCSSYINVSQSPYCTIEGMHKALGGLSCHLMEKKKPPKKKEQKCIPRCNVKWVDSHTR